MRVITYYTNDKYEACARALAESAKPFGIGVDAVKMPHHREWHRNVNHKPNVILRAMLSTPDESILYVDADAVFCARPDILYGAEWDIGAVYLLRGIPSGGTLWFGATKAARSLVEAWAELTAKHPERPDDTANLRDLIVGRRTSLRRLHLPPAYLWHEKTMRPRFPGASPVITHLCVGEHSYPAVGAR